MMAMTPGGLWWSTQVKPVRRKKAARGTKLRSLRSLSTHSMGTASALSGAATAPGLGPQSSTASLPPPRASAKGAASTRASAAGAAAARVDGPVGLHSACRTGNAARVGDLLDGGADASARDAAMEETPLHCAARRCHVGIVRALLAAGADCSARTPSGRLASELVEPPNRYAMVRELLAAAEADVDVAAAACRAAARRIKSRADRNRASRATGDVEGGLSTHVNTHQAHAAGLAQYSMYSASYSADTSDT